MPLNDPRYLQSRAAELRAAVIAELPELPVALQFDAYVGRAPVLTVTVTSPSGATCARDFSFKPLDELDSLRLTNTIVRLLRERYAPEDKQATPSVASL